MSMAKNVRMSLGLTQKTMAEVLGISRALLAQVEIDRRQLRGPAFRMLLKMDSSLYKVKEFKLQPKEKRFTDSQTGYDKKKFEQKLTGLQIKLYRKNKEYEKAVTKLDHLKTSLKNIHTVQLVPGRKDEIEKAMLNLKRMEHIRNIEKLEEEIRERIEPKLEFLNKEKDRVEGRLKDFSQISQI